MSTWSNSTRTSANCSFRGRATQRSARARQQGAGYRLHQPPQRSWWDKLTGNRNGSCGFVVDARDEAGAQALTELAGRAINDIANTVTQSADHVQAFFGRLRTELGFIWAV